MMNIRRMRQEDFSSVNKLLASSLAENSTELPDMFSIPSDMQWNSAFLQGIIDSPQYVLLVAEHDAEVLGYLVGYIRNFGDEAQFFVKSSILQVDDVEVRSDVRNRGIGRALLQEAEGIARRFSCSRVELDVFAFNHSAQEFYKRLGYGTLKKTMRKRL